MTSVQLKFLHIILKLWGNCDFYCLIESRALITFSLEFGPKAWLVTLQVTTWRTSSRWWRSLSTSGNGNRSSLVGRSCFSSTRTLTTSCPSAPTWGSSSRWSTSSAWPSSTTSRPNREQVKIGVVRGFASRQMGESLHKAAQSVVQASKEAIFIT